jgi:hypothetical protein
VRLGSFVGADTPYRAIRALDPDTVLVWSDGHIEQTGVRPNARGRADRSFDAIVDEYGARFRDAMAGAPWSADASVLPLSGGKDSRHILLELHASGKLPALGVTFEQLPWQEANLDVPLSTELARRAGIAHVILPQSGDPLRNEIAKNLLTSLCSDEHTHAMALVRFLEGKHHIIYDGLAGDVLSESKVRDVSWSTALGEGRVAEVAARELGPAGYVERILVPDLARRWSRERALARLEQELGRYCGDPNPFGSYRFWNRARREVALAPLAMLAEGNRICLPYLHPPLFDFLSSLPASLLGTERIHTAAMRRGYPRFADVPFDHERRDPLALPYRPRRTARSTARERVHSARWITGSARYALRGSEWLKPGFATMLAGRSTIQPEHPSLPWLPRMLVYLGMLERIAREELLPPGPAASPAAGEVRVGPAVGDQP